MINLFITLPKIASIIISIIIAIIFIVIIGKGSREKKKLILTAIFLVIISITIKMVAGMDNTLNWCLLVILIINLTSEMKGI